MAKVATPESARTPPEWFRFAVAKAGGQTATAEIVGRTQQAISARLKAGLRCWPDKVRAMESATGVSRHDLDPDLYPREPAPAAPSRDTLVPAR